MRTIAIPLLCSAAFLLSPAGPTPSLANDSSAELSVGGLVFTRSADVSMESEELAISPDIVTVRYRFLNQSPKPVTLTVAFPIPDLDLSEGDYFAIPSNDPTNFLGFETRVNGKPIAFTIHQSAVLGTKDISAILKRVGVPLLPIGPQQTHLSDMPDEIHQQLISQGLLLPNGNDERGRQRYDAAWTVKTAAVRQQTFLPNQPVLVEHRYHTSLGVRFDTVLRKALRQNKAMAAEIDRYRKDYCVTDAFLADLDKLAGSTEANAAKVQERRIDYVLKTGANWAGPIKDFRLKVDKQKPDRLVSFCADPIKPVSPTVVSFTAKDFSPEKDLKILVVGRF